MDETTKQLTEKKCSFVVYSTSDQFKSATHNDQDQIHHQGPQTYYLELNHKGEPIKIGDGSFGIVYSGY